MSLMTGGEHAVEQLEQELGLQIRGLRRARGLTQQQLAERGNTSLGALKNLEAGRGATTRTLSRVLRALDAEDWIRTLYRPTPTFNPLDLPGVLPPDPRSRTAEELRRSPRRVSKGE